MGNLCGKSSQEQGSSSSTHPFARPGKTLGPAPAPAPASAPSTPPKNQRASVPPQISSRLNNNPATEDARRAAAKAAEVCSTSFCPSTFPYPEKRKTKKNADGIYRNGQQKRRKQQIKGNWGGIWPRRRSWELMDSWRPRLSRRGGIGMQMSRPRGGILIDLVVTASGIWGREEKRQKTNPFLHRLLLVIMVE